MTPVRIFIADGQRLFGESLGRALSNEPDFHVVGDQGRTGLEAVEGFFRHRPDVAVLDYWLPGMNGAAITRQVLDRDPGAKVLMLAWLHGPLQLREAESAGVSGFLPKSVGYQELAVAIRDVHQGMQVFPGESRRARSESPGSQSLGLSVREIEVLQLLCEGRSREQVASELGTSRGTLKNHVHNILVKTGTRTVLEAVNLARTEGLIRENAPPGQRSSHRR